MFVNKASRHFRVYNWFNEGKRIPRDFCSYCRTVMFWAPLKAIFFSPWRALFRKSKLAFGIVMFLLFAALETVLFFTVGYKGALTTGILIFMFIFYISFLVWIISGKAEGIKLPKKLTKVGETVGIGLKYGVGLPLQYTVWLLLKTIFWTIWVKVYEFNRVLFGVVLTLAIGGVLGLLAILGLWELLMGIGIFVGVFAAVAVIVGIIILCAKIRIDLNQNIVWQYLKAKKQKICPLIELVD